MVFLDDDDFATEKVMFGPFNKEDDYGGLKVNLAGSATVDTLKNCPSAHRKIDSDISFSIQRENSAHSSTVTYLR